ncbi:MAG: hypothetical protein LBV69_05510 [Bacteroidales bacterium]|nr:hypothetical protein [Bacteroidales bacterium]
MKHYIKKNNGEIKGIKVTLTPKYVERMLRKSGCTKSGKNTNSIIAPYLLENMVPDKRVVLTDGSQITEIKLSKKLYVIIYHTAYLKILSVGITRVLNADTSNKCLNSALAMLENTEGYIHHSDRGVETTNELNKEILEENKMIRSNTKKGMKSKK